MDYKNQRIKQFCVLQPQLLELCPIPWTGSSSRSIYPWKECGTQDKAPPQSQIFPQDDTS